jgi:hypothetical protein
MLRKFAGLAALTLAGAALFVPDATFARGGSGGGFVGFHGVGLRAPVAIHRPPFMLRTGRAAFGRNASAFTRTLPRIAKPLPVHTHLDKPFAHFARRDHQHHRHFVSGYVYPFTAWDDGSYSGSYIGVPYDPGAAIPVYGPAPQIDPGIDPAPPWPAPRVWGMRDEGGEACRAERVAVPGDAGDREITVVRC